MAAFRVNNGSTWMNYAPREDSLLKMAFSAGQTLCKFSLNGATYECDFQRMVQRNLVSGKEREIRLQGGEPRKDGASGSAAANATSKGNNLISSEDDNNKEAGQQLEDNEGNDVITATVVEDGSKRKGWTTRKKALVGAAAGGLGAAAIGGALYGAHRAGRESGGDAAPAEEAAAGHSGPGCEPYYHDYHDHWCGPSPGFDSSPVPPHAGEDPDELAEPDFEDDYSVGGSCGDDAAYWEGSDCDDWDGDGDDFDGFDGFDDGADFDDSGEAMVDIITCMF